MFTNAFTRDGSGRDSYLFDRVARLGMQAEFFSQRARDVKPAASTSPVGSPNPAKATIAPEVRVAPRYRRDGKGRDTFVSRQTSAQSQAAALNEFYSTLRSSSKTPPPVTSQLGAVHVGVLPVCVKTSGKIAADEQQTKTYFGRHHVIGASSHGLMGGQDNANMQSRAAIAAQTAKAKALSSLSSTVSSMARTQAFDAGTRRREAARSTAAKKPWRVRTSAMETLVQRELMRRKLQEVREHRRRQKAAKNGAGSGTVTVSPVKAPRTSGRRRTSSRASLRSLTLGSNSSRGRRKVVPQLDSTQLASYAPQAEPATSEHGNTPHTPASSRWSSQSLAQSSARARGDEQQPGGAGEVGQTQQWSQRGGDNESSAKQAWM